MGLHHSSGTEGRGTRGSYMMDNHILSQPLPHFHDWPQKRHRDPAKHNLIRAKVVQVRKQGYISLGQVIGGMHYFFVDKGLDDIRMVHNGTSCGLNDSLWAPRFGLPAVEQTLWSLLPSYNQCDLDGSEQLLNFPLHLDLREYLGMDVREVRSLASCP